MSCGFASSAEREKVPLLMEFSQITEYSDLVGTHKDHRVQPLSEWPVQGLNPQQMLLATCSNQYTTEKKGNDIKFVW